MMSFSLEEVEEHPIAHNENKPSKSIDLFMASPPDLGMIEFAMNRKAVISVTREPPPLHLKYEF